MHARVSCLVFVALAFASAIGFERAVVSSNCESLATGGAQLLDDAAENRRAAPKLKQAQRPVARNYAVAANSDAHTGEEGRQLSHDDLSESRRDGEGQLPGSASFVRVTEVLLDEDEGDRDREKKKGSARALEDEASSQEVQDDRKSQHGVDLAAWVPTSALARGGVLNEALSVYSEISEEILVSTKQDCNSSSSLQVS